MTGVRPRDTVNVLAPKTLALYGVAKVVPGLIMLGSVPIWIRLYGTANYGTFALVWGAVLFSSALGTGWIRQSVLKFAGDPTYQLRNLSPVWIAVSILAAALPPGIVVWAIRDTNSSETTLALACSAVLFATVSAAYYLALSIAQRDQRAKKFTFAEGVRAAATLIFSLFLPMLVDNYSATVLVLANAAGTIISTSVLLFRIDSPHPVRTNSRMVLGQMWAFGWPMGLWQAVAAGTLYMDRFFINLLVSPTAAGTYAAVADILVRGFTILSYPVLAASHPMIMRAWNLGHRREAVALSRLWTARLGVISLGGTVLAVLICLSLGEWLLGIRIDNSPTLWMLAIGAGSWQLSLMSHKGLEMASRPKLMLISLSAFVVITIPLNVLLIPVWGTTAAAATFAFASSGYCVLTYFLSRRALQSYNL